MTSAEENQQVEAWLFSFPELRVHLDGLEAALESYAQALAVVPATDSKDKLFARLFPDEKKTVSPVIPLSSAPVRRLNPWKWATAASVILLLGMSWLIWSARQQSATAAKELAAANAELQRNNEIVQQQNNEIKLHHHDAEVFAQASLQPIVLRKAESAPTDCVAMAYWDKKTGTLYIDPCRMPNAPAGKQYQLWAIIDGKPVDAGMIKTGTVIDRYRIQTMKTLKNATAFAVTLEKDGGSATPSMDQLYVQGAV